MNIYDAPNLLVLCVIYRANMHSQSDFNPQTMAQEMYPYYDEYIIADF